MQTLTVEAAADYTKISRSSLNKLRVYGSGPLFIKVGARVIYDTDDLDVWLTARKVANTSQTPNIAA